MQDKHKRNTMGAGLRTNATVHECVTGFRKQRSCLYFHFTL